MAEEKENEKSKENKSSYLHRDLNEGQNRGHKGTIIKGHIPDFKFSSPPPQRPQVNDSNDDSDKK